MTHTYVPNVAYKDNKDSAIAGMESSAKIGENIFKD